MTNNCIIKTMGKFNDNIFNKSIVVKDYNQAIFIAEQIIGKFIIANYKANENAQSDNQLSGYILSSENKKNSIKFTNLEEQPIENSEKKTSIYTIINGDNNITINIIPIEQISSIDEFACYENYLINRPIE